MVLLGLFFIDVLIVFAGKQKIEAKRIVPDKFSNGDTNQIKIYIKNNYAFVAYAEIIDEVPEQFQIRNFKIKATIYPKKDKFIFYNLTPKERGEYHFGFLNIYASSAIKLVAKRFMFENEVWCPPIPALNN
ncbi:possible conserved membrane protein [Jejuia pallidilutea]|uniref:Possible conserved membrane protein n=1 Tax=Jejuia pallidilutea TaxID=504487 RepID=A0A090VTL1_9FLAO|nr:possible conserved membrane protein [Jejuia pallidilutea]